MNLSAYLEHNPKKFLIFDLDETILWLRLPWQSYVRNIEEKLTSVNAEILKKYRDGGMSLSELQNAYVKTDDSMLTFLKKYNEEFESQLERYDPNTQLIEFIKHDATHILYLWSSNCRKTVEKTLEAEGILHNFEKLVTRTDVSYIKPDPEGFYQLYKKGNRLQDYLFIGDSKADRIAAENADIDFFEINYFKLIA